MGRNYCNFQLIPRYTEEYSILHIHLHKIADFCVQMLAFLLSCDIQRIIFCMAWSSIQQIKLKAELFEMRKLCIGSTWVISIFIINLPYFSNYCNSRVLGTLFLLCTHCIYSSERVKFYIILMVYVCIDSLS